MLFCRTSTNIYIPLTPRWYANQGISYRHGYPFYGPPGTEKSSLAWAIAGVFCLDIYCISLVEPTLTEEDLGLMFTSLTWRCIVLLEDIDSAGLSKRQDFEKEAKNYTNDAAAKIAAEVTKAVQTAQESNKGKGKDNNQERSQKRADAESKSDSNTAGTKVRCSRPNQVVQDNIPSRLARDRDEVIVF